MSVGLGMDNTAKNRSKMKRMLRSIGVLQARDLPKLRLRVRRSGYSLLEILIVLAIIGLIAALVGPRLLSQLDRSKVTAARLQIRTLSSAVETLRIDLGRYPTQEEGLALLTQPPADPTANWLGPYLEAETPLDPWGKPYLYIESPAPEQRPRIGSFGSDGREGGSGQAADLYFGDGS